MPRTPEQDLPVLHVSDLLAWEQRLHANHEFSGGAWLKIAPQRGGGFDGHLRRGARCCLCIGYEPQGRATVPADFERVLGRNPEAKGFFETLSGANRDAFLDRIQDAKKPEMRETRIVSFIAMLNDRKTFYP